MLPAIIIIGTFVILPILYAVFLSLNKVTLLGGISYHFIGFKSFDRMIDDSKSMDCAEKYSQIRSRRRTCPNHAFKFVGSFGVEAYVGVISSRTIYFLPTITSSAVLTLSLFGFVKITHSERVSKDGSIFLHATG